MTRDLETAERPAVTIVVATHNRARQLGAALQAQAAIRSKHPFELLVVDNASTDDTAAAIAASPAPARYLYCARRGLGAARDHGLAHARGAIVAFTDDDCYPASDYVDALVAVFDAHPEVGCVGGRIILHDASEARITIKESAKPEEFAARTIARPGDLQGANLAFRREALAASGGFDPDFGAGTPFPCEDVDAVAAVMWAGYAARYDPRPTVRHHHGRSPQDIPALAAGYDRGRGAYYAKYAARAEMRDAYLRAWRTALLQKASLSALTREIASATRYLRAKGQHQTIVRLTPWFATTLAMVGRRGLAARLARARGRRRPASGRT